MDVIVHQSRYSSFSHVDDHSDSKSTTWISNTMITVLIMYHDNVLTPCSVVFVPFRVKNCCFVICYFSKCVPCFHFQSFSVIDDSNAASPSSDISGLVAEPSLSGRSHTLIFSSSEVSALLVAQSQKLCGTPWWSWKGTFSQACSLSIPFHSWD